MMFDLDDDETLYAALLRRDPAYEGRAYVGVATTGIFCRLTCPARNPKRENCRFFETARECLEAGFRACKRCRPLDPPDSADPVVRCLLDALAADPLRKWSEADIVQSGHDPSTVRRHFKQHLGMTFLELARLSRLRDGFVTLSEGGRVVDAQQRAGFESSSGFRAAFAKLLGKAPGTFTGREMLKADWIDTPIGAMIAITDERSLHLLEFVERRALPAEVKRLNKSVRGDLGIGRYAPTDQIEAELEAYFEGKLRHFETPVTLHGTAFTRQVWRELQRIPAGQTRTYSQLAKAIGRPSATRAVARANGANQLALIVPCHRVIGADGSLTGYGGGLWRKKRLIELELSMAANTAVAS
ncbi:MAG: trifunctional transcriptional activator/DNA repair protein Ada/methylated-DNA--[protein]-cysteine S-methyltransferase [Pseudomonadota bacterium]